MVRLVSTLACLVLFPLWTGAQEIHKCVSAEGTSYQGHPCDAHEAPAAIAAPGAVRTIRLTDAQATEECAPRPRAPPRLPWRQATICIGMTDDEVLNLPGWGRPDRIVRTREQRLWHEDWTYETRFAVPRLLHFVNAKLAGVETADTESANNSLASLGN